MWILFSKMENIKYGNHTCWVNDLLNNKNTNKVDELVNKLKCAAIKCISNGIGKDVVSGIVINNETSDSFVADINKKIAMMCKRIL